MPGQAQVPEMSGTWFAVETSANGEHHRRARGGGETVIAVEGNSVNVTHKRESRIQVP